MLRQQEASVHPKGPLGAGVTPSTTSNEKVLGHGSLTEVGITFRSIELIMGCRGRAYDLEITHITRQMEKEIRKAPYHAWTGD